MTSDPIPLCVDLDGTLIKTDLLWELLVRVLGRNPLNVFRVFGWALCGLARMKTELARRVDFDVSLLPYQTDFLEYLRAEHAKGRRLILVTASPRFLAEKVAAHLGFFTEVIATEGRTNLRCRQKARCLVERFGRGGFDYAGNSRADIPVWREARHVIVVGAPVAGFPNATVFRVPRTLWRGVFAALRVHQWAKNLIIFVPLLTAHHLHEPGLVLPAVWAFAAFSLCASALYVLNDLLDLEADRRHASRKNRPFASGALPIHYGLALVPVLLVAAAGVSSLLPVRFAGVLALYALLTTLYSFRVKRIALLDVFWLAGLYSIRLVAGHEATGIPYSAWLLVFSMFIFLSLALLKRFQELHVHGGQAHGRGYQADDLELISSLGAGSGYLSVIVLALYVNSEQVRALYQHPMRLLLICPLFLFWVSRVWLLAHRGELHDDPVWFALRDRASYLIAAVTLLIIWLAI
ncbi:MAG: UbiA family prenyltransferase [Verrucomicrobiae bacterium]|nr:UbiA family prenyltransferase [Verrucomicrobiae bacterium]